MIIEKIDIKSFGLITDVTMEFSDKVNIIEGENEAGKSTVAAFIEYMLFGFDGVETEGVLSERRKRINWTTGVAQGSMIVNVKGKRYLISRTTVPGEGAGGRPGFKEDSSIIDLDSGTTAFGKQSAGEVFFEVDRALFENTAFVGQISDSAINEGSVSESIENIIFSASERLNTDRAVLKVKEKRTGLLRDDEVGGVITELKKKQDALEELMNRSNEDNKQILAKETELYRVRTERAECERLLGEFYEQDKCFKNVMLIQTFDQLHELEEECSCKTEEYNSFIDANTRGGYVPTDSYMTDIAVCRRGVNDTYHARLEAEEAYGKAKNAIGITKEIQGNIEVSDTLGGEEKVLADARAHRGRSFRNVAVSVVGALAALAAGVLEIVGAGFFGELVGRIVTGAVGGCALVAAVVFLLLFFKERKALLALADKFGQNSFESLDGKLKVVSAARAKRDALILNIETTKAQLDKARVAYDEAKTELTRVIVRWGEEPPTSELDEFLDRLETKVSSFLEQKRVKLEAKNTIELTVKEIRRRLSDQNEIDIRGQVPPLKRKSMAAINHDDIVNGIANNKARIAELDKVAYNIENELMALKARAGDPGEYYAKLDGYGRRIEELAAKHRAYYLAEQTIASASDNLRLGISPRLGQYATELMGIMTDRKYSDFDVSSGLQVTYLEKDGEKKSVDFLSGGTRDLAYIAVRMALVDMLYTEKPPVCFDESFAHQDNNRAESMMKALAHLAEEGYQSFVFTCRQREAALAQKLVQTPGIFKLSANKER